MRFSKLLGALLLLSLLACSSNSTNSDLPKGFVHLKDIVPNVVLDIRYFGTDNFVGQRVDGYEKPTCIVTSECATQLKIITQEVAKSNYRLKVFDGYRPQRAVNNFSEWALDLNDTLTKSKYYPEVHKSDLFRLNYIASKSGHSRGSTIDLTLVDENGNELDMGSSWDYFGAMSWPSDTTISKEAQRNRLYLRTLMLENGFKPYEEEWWHFTLTNEPYPDTYFDFIVK